MFGICKWVVVVRWKWFKYLIVDGIDMFLVLKFNVLILWMWVVILIYIRNDEDLNIGYKVN